MNSSHHCLSISSIGLSMVLTGRPFRQQLSRFNAIVEDLREHEQRLITVKDRIQAFVEEMPLVKQDVLDWLEQTQRVLEDAQRLRNEIEENRKRCTWNLDWIMRRRLRGEVVKKKQVLEKLLATPEVDQVEFDDFIPGIKLLLYYVLLYKNKSFNLAFDKIMEALKDDAVSMIAVWGMAGVGKTTLAREVRMTATGLNFRAVMISVPSPPDLQKIQAEIAGSLVEMTNEKRVLIILDGVWDGLDLKALGIPHGEDHKGCKILLTTRCEKVCMDMRIQKVIRLDILSDDEACALVEMNVGIQTDTDSPSITDAASEIAKECQGLPIALVDWGMSIRFSNLNLGEIVQNLRSPRFQDDDECLEALRATYQRLRLSYDHLRKKTTKLCFLLCSLFPKDYSIDVEDLTRYAWSLRLFESIDSINKVRCEVWSAIENLKSSCLLVDNGKMSVKMHNLVRHCALWIASQEKLSFMKEWQDVEDLPKELEILSLHGNDCSTISSSSLEGMKSLKVCSLHGGRLSAGALENLTNLRTLHLVSCQLYDISSLGRLKNLEILSFRGSDVSELPDGIGGLNHLRLLDLFDCEMLQIVPLKLMRRLSQLEELYFNCLGFEEWCSRESIETSELISSFPLPPNLQVYKIALKEYEFSNNKRIITSRILRVIVSQQQDTFEDVFPTVEDFYLYHDVTKKQPAVGKSEGELRVEDRKKKHLVFFNDGLSYMYQEDNVPTLEISDSTLERIELPQSVSIWDMPTDYVSLRSLKVVIIKDCQKLKSLFSIPVARMVHLELEKLEIDGCHALKQITTDTSSTLCWPRLQTLEITDCNSLEDVFGISTASFAPRLRVLNITRCPRLNRVVEVTKKHIELPQLQQLALKRLGSFYTFCSGEFAIGLPSLEVLEVEACPQLSSICEIIRQSQLKDLRLLNVRGELCEEIIQLQGGCFLSRLEKLILKEPSELQVLVKDPCQIVSLQYLSHLKVFRCNKLRNIFSARLVRNLPQLSRLEVEECEELEQVVAQDRISSSSMASDQKPVCFPNLEEICITQCNKLKSLFPASFACLPKLKRLKVMDAFNLREIFGHENDANMTTNDENLKEVLLPELKELSLGHLPNLISFTTVGYYFVFPALIQLRVIECFKITMRFSIQDDSGGSGIRAEIEKSKLPKEGNAESSTGMLIIQPDDHKNIEWIHPENRNRCSRLGEYLPSKMMLICDGSVVRFALSQEVCLMGVVKPNSSFLLHLVSWGNYQFALDSCLFVET